jgi:hypothetical protein
MVVAPELCKCKSAQRAEEVVMDAEEAENKPEVGATADAMSAMLGLTVETRTLLNSPALRIVTVAVVTAVALDEAPMAVLMNDSLGHWYSLYC